MVDLIKLLSQYPTMMISKDGCPWCKQAYRVFQEHDITPHVINIQHEDPNDAKALLAEVKSKYKHTSFPIVFKDGKFIGGCDSLENYFNSKENSKNAL